MNLYTTQNLNLSEPLYLFEAWANGATKYTPDFVPYWALPAEEEEPSLDSIREALAKQVYKAPANAILANSYEDLLDLVQEVFPPDPATGAVSGETYHLVRMATGVVDYVNREVHLLGTTDCPHSIEVEYVREQLGDLVDELGAQALCIYLYGQTQGRGILPRQLIPEMYNDEAVSIREELEDEI